MWEEKRLRRTFTVCRLGKSGQKPGDKNKWRGHGGVLLRASLLLTCLTCFLTAHSPPEEDRHRPQRAGTSHTSHESRKHTTGFPTGKSCKGIFSIELPLFLSDTGSCQVDMKLTRTVLQYLADDEETEKNERGQNILFHNLPLFGSVEYLYSIERDRQSERQTDRLTT